MSSALTDNPAVLLGAVGDEASLAHAALIVQARRGQSSLADTVDYLYYVADELGVAGSELAEVIVAASERRAEASAARDNG